MQLETALRVFGLHPNPTPDELNRAFRRLAKRYHPDSNSDRLEWATSHMTSINLAYETIRKSLENGQESTNGTKEDAGKTHDDTQRPRAERQAGAGPSTGRHSTARDSRRESRSGARRGTRPGRSAASAGRPNSAPSTQGLREFSEVRQQIVEGIYIYFQFGLENFRLRYDGPHRLKYRKATRLVMKGLDRFAELWTRHGPLVEEHPVSRFYAFATRFYQVMFLEHDTNPYATKYNRNAYQHYRYGSALLDDTIRDTLFPELGGRNGYDPFGNLQVAWREFSAVISRYPDSDFMEESRLRQALVEDFMDFLAS